MMLYEHDDTGRRRWRILSRGWMARFGEIASTPRAVGAEVVAGEDGFGDGEGEDEEHHIPPERLRGLAGRRGCSGRGCLLSSLGALALPEGQDVGGDHIEVGFLGIAVDADYVIVAVGQAELIVAGLGELKGLGGGGLAEREGTLAFGVGDFDALTLLAGIAEIEVGIDGTGRRLGARCLQDRARSVR